MLQNMAIAHSLGNFTDPEQKIKQEPYFYREKFTTSRFLLGFKLLMDVLGTFTDHYHDRVEQKQLVKVHRSIFYQWFRPLIHLI